MKLKLKTVTVVFLFVLFSVIFLNNNVWAVGRVSQAWIENINGTRALIFRTYTTAHENTLKEYHDTIRTYTSNDRNVVENEKTWTYKTPAGDIAISKWVYDGDMATPSSGQFATAKMIFHDKPFSKYNKTGNWGYIESDKEITKDIITIQEAIDDSRHIEKIAPQRISGDKVLYEINKFIGTYKTTSISTGIALMSPQAGTPVELRHAIINIGGNRNIYVADNIITGSDLTNLISKLSGRSMCYVSEQLIVRTVSDKNMYEFAETAGDFVKIERGWSTSSKGNSNDGMGSALNLYDNELYFPDTSKRKVYVRYINIKDSNSFDTTTVYGSNVEYMDSKNSEKYILVGTSNSKKTTTLKYNNYSEYYKDIEITQKVKKSAITRDELSYLGHNLSVASDLSTAERNIKNRVKSGRFNLESEVVVNAKDMLSPDDVIVIEFYYKERTSIPDDDTIVDPPEVLLKGEEPNKNIPGNVFVKSAEDIQTVCIDNGSGGYSIVSIPSGTKATVGIEGIPQYILAAANIQDIGLKDKTFTFNYTFKAGANSHTKTYTLNYDTTYYGITNMSIYNFNGIEIYDANKGHDGTVGDSIFSWDKGVFSDNSLIKTPVVKMYGLNGKEISNKSSDIQEYSNYITAKIKTSSGSYTIIDKDTNKSEHSMFKTYITETEWNKIDINADGKIDNNDKIDSKARKTAKFNECEEKAYEYIDAQIALSKDIETLVSLEIKNNSYNNLVKQYNEKKGTSEAYIILDEIANLNIVRTDFKSAAVNYLSAKVNFETVETNYLKLEEEYEKICETDDYLVKHYDENYAKYQEYLSIVNSTNSQVAQKFDIKAEFEISNMQVTVDGKKMFPYDEKQTKVIPFTDLASKQNVALERLLIEERTYKYKMNLFGKNGNTIKRSEYINSSFIDQSILNGVRALSGKVKYKAQSVIGNETEVKDTGYYVGEKVFTVETGKEISKTYKVDLTATTAQQRYEEVEPVNIYTPITVTTEIISDKNEVVDQTEEGLGASLIQINTPFTIKIGNSKGENRYNFSDTKRFNLGYYIKFDFDVHKVKIDGLSYKNGQKITAGTWIGFLKGNDVQVTVQAYGSVSDNSLNIISDEKGSYTVRALAYNASEIIRDTITLYPSWEDIKNSDDAGVVENICNNPSYFAETTNNLLIINRMYDFRVTDVKDIEWKTTFRLTSGSVVNKHTGNVYYSGTTKWDTSTTSKVNNIVNRPVSDIGRSPLRILPIGPYKNTDIGKMTAPKLGYRLSFDFKVTGSYYKANGEANTEKQINIDTKFYYISKDGKTFIEESTGNEGIYLFYKNNEGKYVKIDNGGGGYELKYTPNDGYRYIQDTTTNTLSTSQVSLGNIRQMTLTHNMATPTDNKAAITYYGEYKLPNSTIAVMVDSNGKYDINKPLTDGYIGVIFDIYADTGKVTINGVQKSVVLRYGKDTAGTNTSQWDYEGFLGFKNYGNRLKTGELSLKLEKGAWEITNDVYNKIKGTVILYDIDKRAATDFE